MNTELMIVVFKKFLLQRGYYCIVADDLIYSLARSGVHVQCIDEALKYVLKEDLCSNVFNYVTETMEAVDYVDQLDKQWRQFLKDCK